MANFPDWVSQQAATFPNMETTSFEQKQTPKYCLGIGQAMLYKYKTNKTDIGVVESNFFQKLRLYSQGRQDTTKYNPIFGEKSTQDNTGTSIDKLVNGSHSSQWKGWYNIDLENVVSFIPNIVSQITGKLVDVDFDVRAHNIDIDSGAEEEWLMHRKFVEAKFGPATNALRQMAGIPVQKEEYVPQDFSELEQIKLEGGFKAPYISEQEKAIKHTEEISLWDRKLKEKQAKDLIILGRAFAYCDYDHETNKVVWKYAMPEDVIAQYSDTNDYEDSEYAGVVVRVTIAHIRAMKNFIRKEDGSKITSKDLEDLAKKYMGHFGNPTIDDREWERSWLGEDEFFTKKYDEFKIPILKYWWIDVEKDRKIKYTKKNGDFRYYKEDDQRFFNEEGEIASKRAEMKEVRRRVLYQGTMIIGMDWIYDFGKSPNQPVMNSNKPMIPLRGVKLSEESIVKRLMPVADIYYLAWLRLQNAIAKAATAGYAIDLSKLANVSDGRGGKYDPLDLVKMARATGVWFYKSNSMGYQTGGSPVPITQIPSSLGGAIQEELVLMESMMRKVEEITGVSPVALGATPTPDQAVGTTEMSLNAFLDSLKVIIDGFRDQKEGLAMVTSIMIGHLLKTDEKAQREYAKVIGREGVALLQRARNSNVQYGISLKARPTREDWQVLIQIAQASMEKRNQGIAGINEAQYFEIFNAKNTGQNLMELFYKMKFWIRKDEERLQKEKDRAIQLQSQGQQQVIQTQQEEQRKTQQMFFAQELKKIEAEMVSKNRQRAVDSNYHILEMQREYEQKKDLQRIENRQQQQA